MNTTVPQRKSWELKNLVQNSAPVAGQDSAQPPTKRARVESNGLSSSSDSLMAEVEKFASILSDTLDLAI